MSDHKFDFPFNKKLEYPFNPWIPKVGIRGDSTTGSRSVEIDPGSKLTPQEKSIFPQIINEFR